MSDLITTPADEYAGERIDQKSIQTQTDAFYLVMKTFKHIKNWNPKTRSQINEKPEPILDSEIEVAKNYLTGGTVSKEIIDYDHYGNTVVDNGAFFLYTGKDSHIMATRNEQFRDKDSSYEYLVSIKDKIISIPSSVNLAELHKAVTIYTNTVLSLDKMSIKEAKESKLLDLKIALEGYLNNLVKNKPATPVNYLDYLTQAKVDNIMYETKVEAFLQKLIKADIIPQETKKRQYPRDFDVLKGGFLDNVIEQYDALKAKQKEKDNKVALRLAKRDKFVGKIKKVFQDIKLARIQRKHEKERERKEREELKKSIRDMNLER